MYNVPPPHKCSCVTIATRRQHTSFRGDDEFQCIFRRATYLRCNFSFSQLCSYCWKWRQCARHTHIHHIKNYPYNKNNRKSYLPPKYLYMPKKIIYINEWFMRECDWDFIFTYKHTHKTKIHRWKFITCFGNLLFLNL